MDAGTAIRGLHHVALVTRDAERATRFYSDVLGLSLVQESASPTRYHLEFHGAASSASSISVLEEAASQEGAIGIGAIHHVALVVGSYDALLKWKRWLQGNDVLVAGPYNQQAYFDLVLTDPDGVLLELATRGPGFEAIQGGEDVYMPPKESIAPYRDAEDIPTWPKPMTQIEPDMVLQGLHHVSVIASSLEQADGFYRDILTLPLVRKVVDSDDPEVERWYWGLDGGRPGTLVAAFPIVHPDEGGTAEYGRVGTGVPAHYALEMGSSQALHDRATALKAAGMEVAAGLDEPGSQGISIHDPDGQLVELVAADPQPLPQLG